MALPHQPIDPVTKQHLDLGDTSDGDGLLSPDVFCGEPLQGLCWHSLLIATLMIQPVQTSLTADREVLGDLVVIVTLRHLPSLPCGDRSLAGGNQDVSMLSSNEAATTA